MKKFFSFVLSLGLISAICAGVLAFIDEKTKLPIAEIQEKMKIKAARDVMPNNVSNVEKVNDDLFIGRDSAGEIMGFAVTGQDNGGYGGEIVLMVGFEQDRKTIVYYQPLVANETPGLGSKLSSAEFINLFKGKDASLVRVTKDHGEIEAIASATITSRAVCRAIEEASKKLLAAQ